MLEAKWRPRDGISAFGRRPELGELIAVKYRPWRVVGIQDVAPGAPLPDGRTPRGQPENSRFYFITCRPVALGGSLGAIHSLLVEELLHASSTRIPSWWQGPTFSTLPEHFAICNICGDLPPCRHAHQDKIVEVEVARMRRFESANICPSCMEPITDRQSSLTLPNVIAPSPPEIRFHAGRHKCLAGAGIYEAELVDAGSLPKRTLSCSGWLIGHKNGSRECQDSECPGLSARHGSYMQCGSSCSR